MAGTVQAGMRRQAPCPDLRPTSRQPGRAAGKTPLLSKAAFLHQRCSAKRRKWSGRSAFNTIL